MIPADLWVNSFSINLIFGGNCPEDQRKSAFQHQTLSIQIGRICPPSEFHSESVSEGQNQHDQQQQSLIVVGARIRLMH